MNETAFFRIDPHFIKKNSVPDLEVQRLLLQLAPVRLTDISKVTVERVRRSWQLCVKAFASRGLVNSVSDDEVDCGSHRIPLRIYRAEQDSQPRPVLIWYHGGGFVFGDLYTAGATCRALARRTGAIVVAVGYRLLPEHTFGDARSDCLAALLWAAGHVQAIGGDPNRIAIGGDSAGGTLAALAALDSVRLGHKIAMLQLLAYPACDLARNHDQLPDSVPVLTSAHINWLHAHIARTSNLSEPDVSPLNHMVTNELPMTVMLTAGFDPLRDEALEYAQKLKTAGVPLRIFHYPGQFHGFLTFDRVLVGATDALDRLGDTLRQAFDSKTMDDGIESISSKKEGSIIRLVVGLLGPAQRLREIKVACIVFVEALRKRVE